MLYGPYFFWPCFGVDFGFCFVFFFGLTANDERNIEICGQIVFNLIDLPGIFHAGVQI